MNWYKKAQVTDITQILVGDELLYNYPKAPYKGSAKVEKINPDGTIDVLDHSGRYMRGLSIMFGSDPMFKGKK